MIKVIWTLDSVTAHYQWCTEFQLPDTLRAAWSRLTPGTEDLASGIAPARDLRSHRMGCPGFHTPSKQQQQKSKQIIKTELSSVSESKISI